MIDQTNELSLSNSYNFPHEKINFSREEKMALFEKWVQFIKSGFSWNGFSPDLADFLIMHCDMYPYHLTARELWEKYFVHLTYDLRHFLAHFDETLTGPQPWTRLGPAADLARLMQVELKRFLPQIRVVLHWYEVEAAQKGEVTPQGVRITDDLYDRLARLHLSARPIHQPALFAWAGRRAVFRPDRTTVRWLIPITTGPWQVMRQAPRQRTRQTSVLPSHQQRHVYPTD